MRSGGEAGYDQTRHLQRIVERAHDRTALRHNHLTKLKCIYRRNRSEVLWTESEIATFIDGAPAHIARILIAATETGLRPGDLVQLGHAHIHQTPKGRRIVLWTAKRNRLASIPVTQRMAALIDSTRNGQKCLIVNKAGQPYQHENYLGDAISQWRDKRGIRSGLRLYDARGTAATRLLWADASLKEIATCMGWSIRHASEVIGRYAALTPEMSDGIAEKPEAARRGA